jgi:hypothetical protein
MTTPTEQPTDREEYERMWDELIACRDQLADAKLRAMDAANALQLCHNIFPLLALKDEDKAQRICRKGFLQKRLYIFVRSCRKASQSDYRRLNHKP